MLVTSFLSIHNILILPEILTTMSFVDLTGKSSKKLEATEEIDVQVAASMDTISLVVCTQGASLAEVAIKGKNQEL